MLNVRHRDADSDPTSLVSCSPPPVHRCLRCQPYTPAQIVFLNVVSCPEGLSILASRYPKVKVVTAAVDEVRCDGVEMVTMAALGRLVLDCHAL